MLGTLRASMGNLSISRFRTRKVALLLAYLAHYPKRSHFREELADLMWPENDLEISRRNLRQALSSLRHHLEPPELPSGSVLVVQQSKVQLNPDLVTTDVQLFESLLSQAASAPTEDIKRDLLEEAVETYKGELLPGYYQEWVQTERLRLEDAYFYALESLAKLCAKAHRNEDTIGYLRLALAKEPLREELHIMLMEQYLESNRPSKALKQYVELRDILRLKLGEEPSARSRILAKTARERGGGTIHGEAQVMQVEDEIRETQRPPKRQASLESNDPVLKVPVQLTRFYGREADKAEAVNLVIGRNTRLIAVLGPAGTGKTRFSIELGRQLNESHGWNVWFVPLADLSSPVMIYDAIVEALDVRLEANREILPQIAAKLRGSQNLLIMDNLEHIIEGSAELILKLVQEIPNVSCLVTSRQALKIQGEHELQLRPLAAPILANGNATDCSRSVPGEELAQLAQIPSVQLFVNRCQALRPDFQLTSKNANAVALICENLEGIPLSIEIAAGLSNSFTPTQLLQNLQSRLALLKSRRRDIPERHRSLRAAIDYSYQFLDSSLQMFFCSLSVFRGGFTIEAAANVCGDGPIEDPAKSLSRRRRESCLKKVFDLQERSLLRSEEACAEGEARFRLLESFRDYGREQLSETEEEALRKAHADYFQTLSARTAVSAPGASKSVRAERDNFIAAMQYLIEKGEIAAGATMLVASTDGLGSFKFGAIDRLLLKQLIGHPGFIQAEPEIKVPILRMLAKAHIFDSEYLAALETCRQALAIAQQSGNDQLIGSAYAGLASTSEYAGLSADSIEQFSASLHYSVRAGDLLIQESALLGLGTLQWTVGNLDAAFEAFSKALVVGKKLREGDTYWLVLYNLSRVLLDKGELDEAMRLAGEALRKSKLAQEDFGISMSLSLMSRYHWLKHDLQAALALSTEALCKRKGVGFTFWTLNAIQFHGFLLAEFGFPETAASLLAATSGTLKLERERDKEEFGAAIESAKVHLSAEAFERAWAKGLAMNLEEAFDLASQSLLD